MTQGWTRREVIWRGAALGAWALAGSACATPPRATSGIGYDDYVAHDALGLAKRVADGEVQPLELLDTAIARAEAVDPKLNAIVIEHFDRARAAVASGLPKGPFHGVPWLLKDLHLLLEGTVTSYGSIPWRNFVAPHDSTLVDRYEAAGLVIFGKTASPEFGATATTESKLWGQTHNPWNLAHTPGGSSGGSAAAVAAGILPAANASDGGGSIRIPASCCGLFGLKPTRARVPLGPHRYEGASGLSVVHAVTRSVRDSAALLDISHGPAPYDPYAAPPVERPYLEEVGRDPGALRVGWVRRPITRTPVQPECEKAVADAAKLCESLGHSVEETAFDIDPRPYYEAAGINNAVHTLRTIRAREQQLGRAIREEELESLNWVKIARAEAMSAVDMANARETFYRAGESVATMLQRFDVLLTPTQAAPPAKLGVMSLSNPDEAAFTAAAIDASAFTQLYNVTGQPAMSLPLHMTPDGLPVGIMFAAAVGREDLLFRLAAQIEQERPWFDRRPPI